MVVAPGFIDLHSHWRPRRPGRPAPRAEGAPGRHHRDHRGGRQRRTRRFHATRDLLDFVDLNAGLDGRPAGIGYDWDTFASYLHRYDAGQAVNIGVMVGNSALRIARRRLGRRPGRRGRGRATCAAMLREAMQDGAFGVSSGLDYPPGAYATTDELASLTNEAARLGGFYHTHVRYPLGDRFLDPFREALEIGRRGEGRGAPHPFLPSPDLPRHARAAARPGRRGARRRRRRDVGHLPVRVGVDAAAHPAPAVDPGRRARGR